MPGREGGAEEGMGRGDTVVEESMASEEEEEEPEVKAPVRKRRKVTANVQSLLEAVIARQQRFFSDLLESMERKERSREKIRQEREEKWREEERAQLGVFNNALLTLTRELVGDRVVDGIPGVTDLLLGGGHPPPRRSYRERVRSKLKSWRRTEVVQLIKLRGEMESSFAMVSANGEGAALWCEIGEQMTSRGFRRDGKQCREKWEKLMTLHHEMVEGKRGSDETPYYHELANVFRRPGAAA